MPIVRSFLSISHPSCLSTASTTVQTRSEGALNVWATGSAAGAAEASASTSSSVHVMTFIRASLYSPSGRLHRVPAPDGRRIVAGCHFPPPCGAPSQASGARRSANRRGLQLPGGQREHGVGVPGSVRAMTDHDDSAAGARPFAQRFQDDRTVGVIEIAGWLV